MSRLHLPLPALLAVLLLGGVLLAAPVAEPPSRQFERGIAGDGALDAPVPPVGALGGPRRVLDAAEMQTFLRGRALFDTAFHRSRGLGSPDMNGDSCRACHQEPIVGGAGGPELNVFRAGYDDGGAGPFAEVAGGQIFSRLRPPFAAGREDHGATNADVFEQRQTPIMFGVGLIEAIPEPEILANVDPTDGDMNGVFGTGRLLNVGGMDVLGRFGWKAQIATVRDFVNDAFGGELGITTPDDGRGLALVSDADAVADPEVSASEVTDVTFYLSMLAPPPRRSAVPSAQVLAGETLFGMVGCAVCHTPTLASTEGPAHLFSDLLLHNVHAPTFRGMAEPGAPSGFYRTPPLWGSSQTAPYMHDGSAETFTAAILAHDGEATNARQAFEALTPAEQADLIAFLEDL